jgi:hypothetical protein
MKKALAVLTLIVGALIGALAYDQLFIDKSFGPSAMVGLALGGFVFVCLLVTRLLYDTRHRETLANIWLAAFSVVFSYFAIDFIAAFFLIQPLSPPLIPDEYRHHKLVANSYSRLEQRDFSYIQRVNNFGLRGRDVVVPKPAGTYRILMLGDSFTMGKGVQDDETFSVLVEKALNEAVAQCKGLAIEVVNGGVDSYAPVLSLIELKRDLRPLTPDMVVLNLDLSDLVQETAYRSEGILAENGEVVAVPQEADRDSLVERARSWTERHLFLTRALLFYANQFFGYKQVTVRDVVTRANRETVAHSLAEDTNPRDTEWHNVFDSILRMRDYARINNIQFLISIYPWAHQISDTEWNPGRYAFMDQHSTPSTRSRDRITEFAATSGIELVDTFPVFKAALGSTPLYFAHDMHWTPAGQRVEARGLTEHLTSHHLNRWCGR